MARAGKLAWSQAAESGKTPPRAVDAAPLLITDIYMPDVTGLGCCSR
jgi:YesN/AraC family two-component response regulator